MTDQSSTAQYSTGAPDADPAVAGATYEPEIGDLVLAGDGCYWRYNGAEDLAMGCRWESFDAMLKRSDPPQPLTLLVRNGSGDQHGNCP